MKFVFKKYLSKKEKDLKKKIQEFNDSNSTENLSRLKSDLYNVHSIMSQNIDLLMDRDNTLNKMGDKANSLKLGSKRVSFLFFQGK